MPLGSEEINMLQTCQRLDSLLTQRERQAIGRLGAIETMTRKESADLRDVWARVTEDIPRRDR